MSVTIAFGGNRPGTNFGMEYPVSLGLRSGDWINALILNSTQYGGNGGANPTTYKLNDDDYWTSFTVRSGDWINQISFVSATGVNLAGGGLGGTPHQTVGDVLILRIGGSYGDYLNNLNIEYIPNFSPSTLVQKDVFAALDFRAGEVTITTYQEEDDQKTESYDYVTTTVQELTVNASASGQYFVKFSASTGLKTSTTTTTDIKNSTSESLKTAVTTTDTIAADQVGVLLCTIDIMQDSDGNYWVYPTSPANWTKLQAPQFPSLIGYYDFTGGLQAEVGLNHNEQYGFRVLAA